MLIIGGLVALGIVAFLLAFLVLRSGDDEQGAVMQQEMQRSSVIQAEESENVQLVLQEEHEDDYVLPANAQIHELVAQLQDLQQQVRDIELRLSRMDALVEGLEQGEPTLVGMPALQRRKPTA